MGFIIGVMVVVFVGTATMKLLKAASDADDAKEKLDKERIYNHER